MKQTNNAIKFLMAQYRAIFKNANIAMLAAIAASALAAGQAQANPITDWSAISGDKVDVTDTNKLQIATSGSVVNKNGFALTIKSGTHTIQGDGQSAAGVFTVAEGKPSSIKLDSTDTPANNKLAIGAGDEHKNATVTVDSFTNKKGTLEIQGHAADEGKTSALNANTISIGVDSAAENDAVVNVSGHGILNATGTGSGEGLLIGKGATITVSADGKINATTITMTSGSLSNSGSVTAGTLNLAGGTLTATKAVSGRTIKVTGGTVDFGAGGNGALGDTSTELITISGGTIDAKTAAGTIKGKSIKFEKGDIKAVTNELTIEGGFEATGGTLTINDGKSVTFKGNASIDDDVTITLSGTAAKTVKVVGTDAQNNGKLSVSAKQFKLLTDGTKSGSIVLSGANSSTAELHLTDATVDLGSTATTGLNILADNTGQLGTKVTIDGANVGVAKISGIGGTYDKAEVLDGQNKKLALDFQTLTLGNNAFDVKGGAIVVARKTLTIGDGSKDLTISKGQVDLEGVEGSSGNSVAAGKITLGAANTTAGNLNVTAGEWTVKGLEIVSGTATVANDAVLKVTGDLTTKDATNKLVGLNTATIDASSATKLALKTGGTDLQNASTLILDKADVFDGSGNVISANYANGAVTGSANSTINIMEGGKLATISREKFEAFTKTAGFKGLWGVTVEGLVPENTTEMNIGGTDNNLIAGVGTGYENVQAKVDGTKPIDNNYSAGSVALSSGDNLTIGAGGAITLQNANANDNDGMFVSKPGAKPTDKATLAGVNFGTGSTADSSLTLQGSGKIGAITAGAAGSGSVTFGAGEGKTGDVTVEGAIGADNKEIGKLVNNGSNVIIAGASGDVFVQEIDLNGGSFTVAADKKLVLGDGKAIGNSGAGLDSTVDGNLTAGTLSFKTGTEGALNISSNAVVDLVALTGANNIAINVGKDGVANGSATLIVDTMTLGTGSLFIDPDWDQTKASAVAMNLSGTPTDKSAGVLDGKVAVGKNAAFGVGFSSLAEMNDAIAPFLPEGKFSADGVTNALVLNKQITIGNGAGGIMVGENATVAGTTVDQVNMAAGSALVITDNVFDVAADGTKTGTAITFGKSTAADVTVDGAQLFLVGEFTAKDNALNIFESGSNVTGIMNVKSLNGLLEGKWNGGAVDLNLTTDAKKIAAAFTDASAPVRQLLLDAVKGELGNGSGLGRDFITPIATNSLSGAVVDAAAHAATYAGAQQAAVVSVTTMADAMFGRVGAVGVEAASIAATGSQANGGVWLTPMYKSMDADGFNAEGASYGSDVDAAGVAFGADTVNGNMRFGAVFNIGSGDAEGKGNGNGLKDEFDYYGFGIYSAMGFGNFALVGDASMTVVSHDVEGLGLRGKADTTAVTMGITGQYTVATPMVDVTPHLGARFIRLNTDSYDLISADGVLATTDFDVQNVFSVPLGVTLSKAFVAGGWSLAPSADLTVTFNSGDTEAKSKTTFTGVKAIDLNTEVLDEVTYGLTVGLGAQYGAFGTSFGINYTGSENTDAFGVNAQCRYMF